MASQTDVEPVLLPPTMKAWTRPGRGPARTALKLVSDMPTPPVPHSGASASLVLIAVSHVALQANSELVLKLVPGLPLSSAPWVPEMELSGTVVAGGDDAPAELRERGARVVAFGSVPGSVLVGAGVLAEYVSLPCRQVVKIADRAQMDMAMVSGVGGAGTTALKMMRTAGMRERHKVLVNGASGSVGSMLVQICKLRGAKVVGVASGGNEERVVEFGADEFIDYKKHDPLPEYLAKQHGDDPFDAIFDCVGSQPLFVNSPAYLKPEGAVVNVGALDGVASMVQHLLFNTWLPSWLGGVPRRYFFFPTPVTREPVMELVKLLEEDALRVPVDSIFAMEDALDAYDRVATKRARGKVVIAVLEGSA